MTNIKKPSFTPVKVATLKKYGYTRKAQLDVFNTLGKNFTGIINPDTNNGNVFLDHNNVLQGLNTKLKLDTTEGREILVSLTKGVKPVITIFTNPDLKKEIIIPTTYFWENDDIVK